MVDCILESEDYIISEMILANFSTRYGFKTMAEAVEAFTIFYGDEFVEGGLQRQLSNRKTAILRKLLDKD
ncbi:MAG: hypothetical protein ACXQTP_04145 [Candidatus Methanofastidiosia archaeon]